jgi:acetyltransferase
MNTKPSFTPPSVWTEQLRDGLVVQIRPLRPQDMDCERAFLTRLPQDGLARRFVTLVKPIDDTVVRNLTCPDPACEVTIAAFARSGEGETEIGAATYVIRPDGLDCDCTVTVDPDWQKLGIGRALMRRLIDIARAHGIRRMYATTEHHAGAHALGEHLGFHARPDPEDPLVTTYELALP